MGGVILSNQLVWKLLFPKGILSFTTTNYLKFLAMITHLLFIEHWHLLDNEHLLIWIDNICAITWTRQSPRSDDFADFLFRMLGMILMRNNFTMWGCYLLGEENCLADKLSRAAHLKVQEALTALHSETNTRKLLSLNKISIQELPPHLKLWISATLHIVMQEKVPSAPSKNHSLVQMDRICKSF